MVTVVGKSNKIDCKGSLLQVWRSLGSRLLCDSSLRNVQRVSERVFGAAPPAFGSPTLRMEPEHALLAGFFILAFCMTDTTCWCRRPSDLQNPLGIMETSHNALTSSLVLQNEYGIPTAPFLSLSFPLAGFCG